MASTGPDRPTTVATTRPRTPVVVAGLLLLACAPVASPAADWERYVPRTIASVIAANASQAPAKTGDLLVLGALPSRTRVTSRGQFRALAGPRLDFVVRYFSKVRGRPDWAQLFRREVLVDEGGAGYWLPIQESLATDFEKEIGTGAPAVLYVSCIGAIRTADSTEWVFLVNRFDHVGEPINR